MAATEHQQLAGRRLVTLVVVLGLIAVPAAVLRVMCVGASCEKAPSVASEVPFCSLPSDVRTLIGNGFRTGRSADILTVARPPGVEGGTGSASHEDGIPWSRSSTAGTTVPIVFSGTGVDPGPIRGPVSLDDIAPTEAAILGLHRAHPEVRSGSALPGVASGDRPRLLLEIAITGISSSDLDAWPHLRALMSDGASTTTASTGSLPVDPAAILTTIGTGGLPYQHGVTGAAIRTDKGRVTTAWGRHAPVPVIATLGDDLDRAYGNKARIGIAAPNVSDRGAIGGDWYLGSDKDDLAFGRHTTRTIVQVRRWLEHGYGADNIPDFVVAVLDGHDPYADAAVGKLVSIAHRAVKSGVTVVATATGASAPPKAMPAQRVVDAVTAAVPTRRPLISSVDPQGFFLNQHTVATEKVSEDDILKAVESMTAADGKALMDQVFPALAVSFERYC